MISDKIIIDNIYSRYNYELTIIRNRINKKWVFETWFYNFVYFWKNNVS